MSNIPSLASVSTTVDTNSISKLKLDSKGPTQSIESVASEFESIFLSLMLKEMRNTLDSEEGGLFGKEGSDTFGGMFDLFMGQHLAKAQPLGIGDAVKGYLSHSPTKTD